MPSLNFPTATTVGEQYLDWVWNGVGWDSLQTLPGGLPAGAIIQWGGSTAPVNWLLCDGSAVSRTTYSSLFAAVGTSYGTGDGSTTFNLPDLRGRVPVGKNGGSFSTLGATGGAETHVHGSSTLLGRWFNQYYQNRVGDTWTATNSHSANIPGASSTVNNNGIAIGGNTDAGSSLQPYQVVNYIIKATAAITPGESELAPRVSTLENADATTNKSGLVPIVPTSVGAISTGTASVNSSGLVTFSGVNGVQLNGVFTSTYTNYRIVLASVASGHNLNAFLRMRNAGTDTSGSIYYFGGSVSPSTGGVSGWSGSGANVIQWGNASIESTTGVIDIFKPKVADRTGFGFQSFGYTATYVAIQGAGMLYDTVSYDGVSLYLSSGNFTGTVQVYGYR